MNQTSEPLFYVTVETVDVWHVFVANGSDLSSIMIFDESKKIKLNRGMSEKRKIERLNALLRQRQDELVSSFVTETEEVHNSTVEMLSTSIYSPERPLVIIILQIAWSRLAWNLYSDEFSDRQPNRPVPRKS